MEKKRDSRALRTYRGWLILGLLALSLTACKIDGLKKSERRPANISGPRDVYVTWTASKETAVTMPGGGYRVYYSTIPNFTPAGPHVDVPYNAATPTAAIIPQLSPRKVYYIKVVPYSALNTAGTPSTQISVTTPW